MSRYRMLTGIAAGRLLSLLQAVRRKHQTAVITPRIHRPGPRLQIGLLLISKAVTQQPDPASVED
jgi:hypothetical protein